MKKSNMFCKLIAVMLLLCMITSLAGCGEKVDPNVTQGSDVTTTATVAATTTQATTTETSTQTEMTTTAVTVDPNLTVPDIPAKGSGHKVAVISGAGAGSRIYSKMAEMTGKENPKCLIITAAGKDDIESISDYTSTMKRYTKDIEVMTLCTKLYTQEEIRSMILGADMILEVGGQSEFMDEVWKKFNLPEYLTEAYNNGVVICGGSAGGMCWTYAAWNDFYELPESVYKWFYGIDLLHFYYGPHYHDNSEWTLFHGALMSIKDPKYPVGYAMDSGTGLVIVDGEVVQYLRENNGAFIWDYTFQDGKWKCVKHTDYN